jgi:hypothetical protein
MTISQSPSVHRFGAAFLGLGLAATGLGCNGTSTGVPADAADPPDAAPVVTPDAAPPAADAFVPLVCDPGPTEPPAPTLGTLRTTSLRFIDPQFANSPRLTNLVNDFLAGALEDDGVLGNALDCEADFSVLVALDPPDPQAAEVNAKLVLGAACPLPIATSTCTLGENSRVVEARLINSATGPCGAFPPGTMNETYDPKPTLPTGPCFTTAEPVDIELSILGLTIPARSAGVAARYEELAPAGEGAAPLLNLVDGVLWAFVSEADAAQAKLPDYLPVGGGLPITVALPVDEKDEGPDGTPGWWFYLSFTGAPVAFVDPTAPPAAE